MSEEFKDQAEFYVTEFLKCKKSFEYFCSSYIVIEQPGGDVFLVPYAAQSKLIKTIQDNKFVLVLKSRQIGISTITQAYATWLTVFYDNAVIGIISKDGPEATSFARTIAGMIEKLPSWMKPKGGNTGSQGFAKRSEQSFILTNGSKCYAATVNPKAPWKTLRGKALTFLIIDEAAFVEYLDDAWTSMIPALSTNQKHARTAGVPYGILVLSTPNKTVGVGAWFFKKYTDSVAGDGILKNHTIHWRDIPELSEDPEWYKNQCELFDNDPKKIDQELEMKFVATSGTFFDDKVCTTLQENVQKPYSIAKTVGGEVWKFNAPVAGQHYLIGVDTASEFGTDKSAITVWNYETLEQVWEYNGKCEVQDFIKIVQMAAASYPGTIVIENNSYGDQVVKAIRDDGELGQMLYFEKTGKDERILKPGITTNSKTRPLILESLYDYVSHFPESVKSERLVMELIGLVEKKGRVEADRGCNDDLAISAGIAFYVRKYDPPMYISRPHEFMYDFTNIMDYNNDDGMLTGDERALNSKLMKRIKEVDPDKIKEGKQYINTFDILFKK